MKLKELLTVLTIIAIIIGCKQEFKSQLSTDNYYPLEIGNYWVYNNYTTHPSGEEVLVPYIDSIIVVSDTVINETLYNVLASYRIFTDKVEFTGYHFRTDSSGYLVNLSGEKLFSQVNFNDTLSKVSLYAGEEAMCTMYLMMKQTPSTVSVPAGKFKQVVNRVGVLELNDANQTKKHSNVYYASGVGKVKTEFPNIHSDKTSGQKLVRYYVN